MAAGADVVGGCPHLDPDHEAALDIALSVSAELVRPSDLHTDETLDPSAVGLRRLAARVAEGFGPAPPPATA
jgi:cytosine deaminase